MTSVFSHSNRLSFPPDNFLFGIHFGNQAAQLRGCWGFKLIELFSETPFADCANLVNRDLGFPVCAHALQATAPAGVKLRCQRAHDDGVQMTVHFVLANDDYRSDFVDFAAARGIQVGEIYAVALDRACYHEPALSFRPSSIVASKSLQSSRSRDISL